MGATIPFSLCDADEGRLHNEGSVFKLHTVTSVDLSNRSGRWRQVSFVRRGRTIWSEPIRTESSPSQAFVQQLLGVAADGFHRRSGGHKWSWPRWKTHHKTRIPTWIPQQSHRLTRVTIDSNQPYEPYKQFECTFFHWIWTLLKKSVHWPYFMLHFASPWFEERSQFNVRAEAPIEFSAVNPEVWHIWCAAWDQLSTRSHFVGGTHLRVRPKHTFLDASGHQAQKRWTGECFCFFSFRWSTADRPQKTNHAA